MRITTALAAGVFTVLAGLATASSASAEIQLSIHNGRVTLIAKDATLRQILAEWAKVGQTRVVNGDRVPGGPLTLQLTDVPELQALDVLLRSLSGYLAVPRATAAADFSQFDRILVMPTIAPPLVAVAGGAPPPPAFPQPNLPPGLQTGMSGPFPQQGQGLIEDDDQPNPNRGPVFNTFPQPQIINQMQQGGPTPMPGGIGPAQGPLMLPSPNPNMPVTAPNPAVPGGVSIPGMIVPVPQQPGQPLSGQPPPQPKRPGGL